MKLEAKRLVVLSGISAFLLVTTIYRAPGNAASFTAQGSDTPRNVELTNAAWAAFEKQDYEGAIAASDRAIRRFKGQADAQQQRLEKISAPLPPNGKVGEKEKAASSRRAC